MYRGGSSRQSKTDNLFRFAGLFIPVILVIHGALLQSSIIKGAHAIDNVGLLVFSFWWLFIASLQFLFKSESKLELSLRLTVYHLLAGAYLIFVSGSSTSFAVCWIILMLISYSYFALKGLVFNIVALTAFIAVDLFLWHRLGSSLVMADLITYIAINVSGLIILKISKIQETSVKEMRYSRSQELLQRDRALTIINNLADAVLSTDMHGVVRIYNAASMGLLNTNVGLDGHYIDEILPLKDKDGKKVSLFKELQEAKTVTKRDDLVHSFGPDDYMQLEITYSPIQSSYVGPRKSGIHDGYAVILRDVTKAKSLEEERDEFISVVSHELRTPLTIAEGTVSNAEVMLGHPDVTNSMLLDAIKTAHEQIIFLSGMVNDLSTLSRAERGAADATEDIDVKELAHKLHDKYDKEARQKKLQLDLDLSAKLGHVHTSRLYLEEILQNLITNSIKYTQKGHVKIIFKQSKDRINFAIKDTGIGISKSDQAKIFKKFYRSEDYRTRETGGTGLGLYVVEKLSKKLGTKIKFTSRLNFGSTFSFELPAVKKKDER